MNSENANFGRPLNMTNLKEKRKRITMRKQTLSFQNNVSLS